MQGPYSQMFEARIYTKTDAKNTILRLVQALKKPTKASALNHLKLFMVEEILFEGKYCIDLKCINEPDSCSESHEKASDNIPEFLAHLKECILIENIEKSILDKILFLCGVDQTYVYYDNEQDKFVTQLVAR